MYRDRLMFRRQLRVYFYTSSVDKLLQARLVFTRNGYVLHHFRSSVEPYDEDYELGTHELLKRALSQIEETLSVRSCFFVEDTSLRLEALSDKEDFPGLAVKEWFSRVTFDEVDKAIKERGGNRRAIIKSDIALSIPNLSRPLFFHGEVAGTVATTPPSFVKNSQYPWLTPDTFNGWFIPDGATRRLGEMSFEESLHFDFRVRSLNQLIERIDELNAVVNLNASYFSVKLPEHVAADQQIPLLPMAIPSTYIVIGNKCAGKTTFGDYAAGECEAFVVEASSIFKSLCKSDGIDVESTASAHKYLREKGMDLVAQEVVKALEGNHAPVRVVTGLRTVEELEYLVRNVPSAKIVLIEADSRIRFERHIKRARDRDVKDYKSFQSQDEEQRQFGLLRAAHEFAHFSIQNEGTILEYRRRIADLLKGAALPLRRREPTELHRSLQALAALGKSATCVEISDRTKLFGHQVRKYNVNRSLKTVSELAQRIEKRGALLRYRITPSGAVAAKLLELLAKTN